MEGWGAAVRRLAVTTTVGIDASAMAITCGWDAVRASGILAVAYDAKVATTAAATNTPSKFLRTFMMSSVG